MEHNREDLTRCRIYGGTLPGRWAYLIKLRCWRCRCSTYVCTRHSTTWFNFCKITPGALRPHLVEILRTDLNPCLSGILLVLATQPVRPRHKQKTTKSLALQCSLRHPIYSEYSMDYSFLSSPSFWLSLIRLLLWCTGKEKYGGALLNEDQKL